MSGDEVLELLPGCGPQISIAKLFLQSFKKDLTELSLPTRHSGNTARSKRSRNRSLQRVNILMEGMGDGREGGREGINSQIGSRPDEEESRSLMRGLGRVSVGCGIAFLYRMLSVDLLGKAPLTS